MEFKQEFNIKKFNFWAGAKEHTKELSYSELETLGEWIELTFEAVEDVSAEDINNLVWFEFVEFEEYLNEQ